MFFDDEDENELNESAKMSFLDHLDELRSRIIYSLVALAIGFLVCWAFSDRIYNYMAVPITQHLGGRKLVFTNPTDPFTLYMKIALIAGAFVTSPFILWQVWLFISPGLYKRERKYAVPFIFFSSLLFILGGVFAHTIAFPMTVGFLLRVGESFEPMVTITEYFDLYITVILGSAIIFEIPILIFFLSIFGIVNARFLLKNLRYAILIIFIVAAVVTPTTDIPTMMVFAMPMLMLYVVGIGVAWLFGKKGSPKQKKDQLSRNS
jgi:sec-independent protein translocase protein TatC